MTDFDSPDATDQAVLWRPPAYQPRADAWAEKSSGMPSWAKRFARSGYLLPEPDRTIETDNTAADDAQADADRRYSAAWRGTVRELTRLKSEAALLIVAHRKDTTSAIFRAAVQRGFDVDEEWCRLRVMRDKRAPLVLRSFGPVDGSNAGRPMAAVERDRSREPLFGTMKQAGMIEDPVDSLPMDSM